MGTSSAGGKLEFEMNLGKPAAAQEPEPDEPFRIAVLGDLSGRANRVLIESVSSKRFRRFNIDNFEQVQASLGAALKIPLGNDVLDLSFETLEDFHPDSLVRKVGPLKALAALRQKVVEGAPLAAVEQELKSFAAWAEAPDKPTTTAESSEQTLTRLLGAAPSPKVQPPATQTAAAVEQILRKAVGGSAVPSQSERQAAIAAIDLELSSRLRGILHHPAFQSLEASWRGLDLLVRNFGGEEAVEMYLADIAQHELAADAAAAEKVEDTGLFKLMRSRAEEAPLGLCVGLYEFGAEESGLRLLSMLARVSARFGVATVAQASSFLSGCDSFGEQRDPDDWKRPLPPELATAWSELRRSSEAAYVALATPRFLLRQPYGAESEQIESFPFEEMGPTSMHEEYLWGNAAIACAYVLARQFQEEGWNMRAEGWGELDGLPVHRFIADGEKQVKPCGEAWLSDRAGEVLQKKGLLPLLSIKGRDAVRVGRVQSMHNPPTALRGRWSRI